MEEYTFDPQRIAERHLTDLRTGELNRQQTKFLLDYYTDRYNNEEDNFSRSEFTKISKWIKQTGSPEINWSRMKKNLEQYASEYIESHDLETQNEELPESGFSEEEVVFIPHLDIGYVAYDTLYDVEVPEDVWFTQKVHVGYRKDEGFEFLGDSVIYHGEESAKEYFEMLCNGGNIENLKTAENLLKEAVSSEEYDVAFGLGDILLKYSPETASVIIDEDLSKNQNFLADINYSKEEAESKASKLSDLLDDKTDKDFE